MRSSNIQPSGVQRPTLVLRTPKHPDHHLWLNYQTWWVHYTVYYPDHTKKRYRHSLGTTSILEARRKRDQFFRDFHLTHHA